MSYKKNRQPFDHDMYTPEMGETSSNPFDEEASSTGENDNFGFKPKSRKQSDFTWGKLGLGVVGLIFVIGIIYTGYAILNGQAFFDNDHEKTTLGLYDALRHQDYNRAAEFFEDAAPSVALQFIGSVQQEMEKQLRLVVPNFKLTWEFQELSVKTVERNGDNARVRVIGKMRVFDAGSKMGLTFPYDVTHTLIRKNSKWYVKVL